MDKLKSFLALFIASFLFVFNFPNSANSLDLRGAAYDQVGSHINNINIPYLEGEFVNPYSGNLFLTFTDISLPGNGGLELEINRFYNSKFGYYSLRGSSGWFRDYGTMGLGWKSHFGVIDFFDVSILQAGNLTMPDGSVFQIYNNNNSNITSHKSSEYIAENFAVLDFNETAKTWTMTLPDGTVYTFDRAISEDDVGFAATSNIEDKFYTGSITDTNGNTITIEYYDCCNIDNTSLETRAMGGTLGTCDTSGDDATKLPLVKSVTDSVGRVITFGYMDSTCRVRNGPLNAIKSIDVNGNIYNYKYVNVLEPDGETIDGYALVEFDPPSGGSTFFAYEADDVSPNGELEKIQFPSGGIVEYSFSTLDHNAVLHSDRDYVPAKTRVLTSRKTSGPEITTGTWTYAYGFPDNSSQTTVTDPCGRKTVYKFHGFLRNSHIGDWAVSLLKEKEILDTATDSTLQKEVFNWSRYQISDTLFNRERGYFYPRLDSKTITRDGVDYKTEYTYGVFYDSPTKIVENLNGNSDNTLTRTTDITYFQNISEGKYIISQPATIKVKTGTETKTITNTYDKDTGNLTKEDRYGVATEFGYHSNGNLKFIKNARGFFTHFDKYSNGIAGEISYGSSSAERASSVYKETRTINWEGTIASLTNGRGLTSSFEYDGVNRLTKITPPMDSGETVTSIIYNEEIDRDFRIRKGTNSVQFISDGFQRPLITLSYVGTETRKSYDACGRETYRSLPFNNTNRITPNTGDSFTYDKLDRLKTITHPDNTVVGFTYNANSVTVNDERNRNSTYKFKSFGDPDDRRLISITDALAKTTTYRYDLLGNITGIVSPSISNRSFVYNTKNFLTSEVHPENGTTSYTHDEVGNIRSRTIPNGSVINYQYDALDRLIKIDHPGTEEDVLFGYDNTDNITSISGSGGGYSYSYEYDESDMLIREVISLDGIIVSSGVDSTILTSALSSDLSYTYDDRNNLTQITYPSGELAKNFNDNDNLLRGVLDSNDILFAEALENHANGSPRLLRYGNRVEIDFTYDNRHRLDSLSVSRSVPELAVKKAGNGFGTVSDGITGGLDCGSRCRVTYNT